jgi:hypothetical protein
LNIGVLSTLLKGIVNFSWKVFIIYFLGKYDAAFIFIGFAIGSFFGTLFDVSYGAFFLKKIKNKNLFINVMFIMYILLVFLFLYILKILIKIDYYNNNIFILTTVFSVLGSYFMIQALRIRQQYYELRKLRLLCYKTDIYLQIVNFIMVPIIFYLDKNYLFVCFFLSSVISYLIYSTVVNNDIHKKNFL